LTVSPALPHPIEAGTSYRIREPGGPLKRRNRWRDRRVRFSTAEGVVLSEVDVTHSDDKTLFFAQLAAPIEVGATYEIIDYAPGGVWKFQTTEPSAEHKAAGLAWQKIAANKYWVQPKPGDPDRGSTFHADMEENLPTTVTRYGRVMKGDYVSSSLANGLYHAIYRGNNVLTATKPSSSWSARGEGNHWGPFGESELYNAWTDAQTEAESIFTVPGSVSNGRPRAYVDGGKQRLETVISYTAVTERRYAYLVTSVPTIFPCVVDFYGHTDLFDDAEVIPPDETQHGATLNYEFDDNGDPVLQQLWSRFSTVAATPGVAQVVSEALGTDQCPSFVGEPTTPPTPPEPPFKQGPNAGRSRGYRVDGEAAVARWTRRFGPPVP
ncbi:MAG: hypothetical protein WBD40_07760, partial [Tepidisphaeraceae bacterium]